MGTPTWEAVVSSAGSSAGSTPGSTPTGSTSAASTSTGTTVAPTTESVEALSQKVNEAAATKAAAEEVGSALTSIDLSAFVGTRKKRQATTTTYAKPSNCDGVKAAMVDITNALDGTNDATYNPTKALTIVAILKALTAGDLSPSCSQNDVSELETAKESASSKAAEVVATQTNKIAKATEEFNAAVALISTINEALESQGATTVEAGTTAAPVATVTGGLTDVPTTTATETATTLSANPTTVTDTNASGSTSSVAQTITVTASSAAVSGSPARRAALRE